ncbi:MAG: galactokinase family protein [Oscillospiraceae bacterium]|nr:galactokinase family protein [Oscillospiraceae bacterium]
MEFTHVLRKKLADEKAPEVFSRWYESAASQPQRYLETVRGFENAFGTDHKAALFSSPGRCEFIGNHTDHQQGRVVAAAITLDVVAAAAPNGTRTVRIVSEGYTAAIVDLEDLAPRARELGETAALIRGVAAGLTRFGFSPAGFDAYVSSQLPSGAGLSSSAAFECLLGTIFNSLFCGGTATPVQIARAGRLAESEYFGKPCGLMDQLACAVGGFAAMDLTDPANPQVRRLSFSVEQHALSLFAVNTGGSHADLINQYAAIPAEMKAVAAFFGQQLLCSVPEETFWAQLGNLHGQVPDRAILRAIHFFEEDGRAARMVDALAKENTPEVLGLLAASGRSSQQLLQNAWPDANPEERGLSLAMALSEHLLQNQGACRIHGGGFAGSILALMPSTLAAGYRQSMEAVFGLGSCRQLAIRPEGAAELFL